MNRQVSTAISALCKYGAGQARLKTWGAPPSRQKKTPPFRGTASPA